jgi:hypothetical protein
VLASNSELLRGGQLSEGVPVESTSQSTEHCGCSTPPGLRSLDRSLRPARDLRFLMAPVIVSVIRRKCRRNRLRHSTRNYTFTVRAPKVTVSELISNLRSVLDVRLGSALAGPVGGVDPVLETPRRLCFRGVPIFRQRSRNRVRRTRAGSGDEKGRQRSETAPRIVNFVTFSFPRASRLALPL